MAKVFRLYNIQGDPNIVDWKNSNVYGSTAIGQITDPDGADAKKEITSIPSPFARIDLVKTAFKEVNDLVQRTPNHDNLTRTAIESIVNGKTIYHRMVSDTLDVAEIFFNYDRFKNFFEIIVWDRKKDLDENNVFGKTLKRYLDSDSKGTDPYNFSKLDRIYLLNYIGPDKPASMNIVGATSPATLFFSSANKLDYVSKHISFDGQDKPFDNSFQPLFKRNFEFQKYLYAFRKAYKGRFSNDFQEIYDYLEINYRCLSDEQKNQIDALTESSINDYEPILIGDKGENQLEVLGSHFHKKPKVSNWKSDFEIKSDLYTDGKKPLVLPVEKGNVYANLKFTTNVWGKENKAPCRNKVMWVNRHLPGINEEYPYLTISDFLADTIVRMPYKLNDESFYNGGYNSAEDSYLLPLKELFFRFFTTKDLQGTVDGGKKMFEIVEHSGKGVTAILRIPIQKGFIEYRQMYFDSTTPVYNEEKNDIDGATLEKKFGLGIMPLIKFPEEGDKYYRIALFDKGQRDVKLTCYKYDPVKKETHLVKEEALIVREAKDIDMNECSKESYVITDNFDRINVSIGDAQGVIIPKFDPPKGNKIFTFAIDFGTTNTHIEYGVVTSENSLPSNSDAFDIPLNEKQMHRLHTLYSDRDINGAFVHNFVPDTVGDKKNDDFSFPMRTVFSKWSDDFKNEKYFALAHGNVPFLYEKEMFPEAYNEPCTELKWRGEEDDYLVQLYLENIFLLIRNKVVLNGGNLKATKIIWFYPASMDTGKFDNFNGYWAKFYKKYFGGDAEKNLITISESAAPHRYYKRKKGAASEVVTIDVGGGTTDVYIVEDDKPQMLLSFLFASSAIFGDGGIGNETRWDSDSNGFIQRYYNEFIEILNTADDGNLQDLAATLQQIEKKNRKSSDIVAFLFSLFGNKKVKGNESLNFLAKLSNNKKFKYVFILFYGAILYFIAKSMKTKGLKRPLTLAFSGNGAKTLRVLSSNNNTIGEFAKLIFDDVYGTKGSRLDIIFEDEPKKATSKGGILNSTPQMPDDIKKIKFTLIGNNMDNIPSTEIKFEQITEETQKNIIDSVSEFVDFLFELHENNDDFLHTSLGADDSIIDKVKEICKDRVEMEQSLKHALSYKKGSKKVEETLFFYPLIGVLHELAQKVNRM